jgi:histidyl-tRNA synthetase
VEVAHAGLVREALNAAGLDRAAQIEAYDRLLSGAEGVADDLLARYPQGTSALRLLFGVSGDSSAYIANLRASLGAAVPSSMEGLAELEEVTRALDGLDVSYRVQPATARNLEYYSGVTFRVLVDGRECMAGGRYDALCAAIGGAPAPACGFGADQLGLAALRPARVPRRRRGHGR